jgi:alpha-galactosidase
MGFTSSFWTGRAPALIHERPATLSFKKPAEPLDLGNAANLGEVNSQFVCRTDFADKLESKPQGLANTPQDGVPTGRNLAADDVTMLAASQEKSYPLHFAGVDVHVVCTGKPEPRGLGYIVPAGPVLAMHSLKEAPHMRHGWQSWSQNLWIKPGEPDYVLYPNKKHLELEDGKSHDLSHTSFGMTLIEGKNGNVLLLGALGLNSSIKIGEARLCGTHEGNAAPWFMAYGPEQEVMAQYAAELRQSLCTNPKIASPEKRVGSLWCSWYNYWNDISESQLLDDLDSLKGFDVDVFQIDDGWQTEVGDWGVNGRFPRGLEFMTEQIKATGRTPGLWIAPFIGTEGSRLFRDHPDWFVHDKAGKPIPINHNGFWDGQYYGLDLTLPAVQDHVRRVIRQARQWGFEFLKLDFLFAGAMPGERADNSVSREEIYRNAVELIRQEAGDDCYLLACGAPIFPSLGVFDGIRASTDTGLVWSIPAGKNVVATSPWPAAAISFRNTLHRLWLNPVIQVDPDVVFFQPWRPRSPEHWVVLSKEHKQITRHLATVAGLKGTSDPVADLPMEAREALRDWLRNEDVVRQKSRYVFEINGEDVDFEPYLHQNQSIF